MTATITVEHEGIGYVVDLTKVTGLDAIVYRQATGENLDALLTGLLQAGTGELPLADCAVCAWLCARQNGHPNATLPDVAALLTMLPTPDGAGVVAPEVT